METKKKEPLIRIEKRSERPHGQIIRLRLLSVLFAILAGGLFILFIGYNPFSVYGTIISGAFRSTMAFQATIKLMVPLLIPALGITLAFKMRFWNIGAEGQIIMGAIFATYFALFCWDFPHWLLMICMFLAGMLGGALWGLIPAFFKAKFDTNETLFTLMLNYVALYLISFLRDGPWKDPNSSGFPKIARFGESAQLDKIFGVHAGWLIGLVLVVIVYVYLKFTKQGYEIGVVGESRAICGIAGMVQATGSDMTLATSVAGGVGFTAIIVAWLAQLNPVGILVVSFLFAVLEKGSTVMQSAHGLSAYSADVLQGVILFFVLGCEFFVRYKFVTRRKGGQA